MFLVCINNYIYKTKLINSVNLNHCNNQIDNSSFLLYEFIISVNNETNNINKTYLDEFIDCLLKTLVLKFNAKNVRIVNHNNNNNKKLDYDSFYLLLKFYLYECYTKIKNKNIIIDIIEKGALYFNETILDKQKKISNNYLFTFENNNVVNDNNNNNNHHHLLTLASILREKLSMLKRNEMLNYINSLKNKSVSLKNIEEENLNNKAISLKSLIEINNIFNLNVKDNITNQIFNYLSNNTSYILIKTYLNFIIEDLDKNKRDIIVLIYSKLVDISQNLICNVPIEKKASTNVIIKYFNAKNHLFEENELTIINEFKDSLLYFHKTIINNQSEFISKENFLFFFRISNFLIKQDSNNFFEQLLYCEWKNVIEIKSKEKYLCFKDGLDNDKISEVENVLFENNSIHEKSQYTINNDNNFNNIIKSNNDKEFYNSLDKFSIFDKDNNYKHNDSNNNKFNSSICINYEIENILYSLSTILIKRGVKGLMNLHKQFIINCNINQIYLMDMIKIFELQRIDLSINYDLEEKNNENIAKIFKYFTDINNSTDIINYVKFIKYFKKPLNNKRLSYVKYAFQSLDKEDKGYVSLELIKIKYNYKSHPKVLNKQQIDELILVEFFDSFELNYNLLASVDLLSKNNDNNNKGITYLEFLNYYEYVSFLHLVDEDFIIEVANCWNLQLIK